MRCEDELEGDYGEWNRGSRCWRDKETVEPSLDSHAMWYASMCKLSCNVFSVYTLITYTCTSSDDSSHTNVEGTVPISRPDDIHHRILIVINRCRDRPGSQQVCGNGQQLRSPLKTRNVKCAEECTNLCGVDCPCNEKVLNSELQIVWLKYSGVFTSLVVQQWFKCCLGVRFCVLMSQWYQH